MAGMITILSTVISIVAFRFRRRASLELELIGLRHQVSVLRRQHPGRVRLFSTDRLLWIWLYRVWPQVLNAMAHTGLAFAPDNRSLSLGDRTALSAAGPRHIVWSGIP
jgi:hypothetical protein